MKTVFSLLLSLVLTCALSADKYLDQMTANITVVYTSKSVDELKQAVNTFERIGNAEKNKWEPFYYAAFGNIMIATRESSGSQKDLYLDQAAAFIAKATAIAPQESEIAALEGFMHTIRLTVDPQTRGQQYSMLSMQSFGKALQLNPNNPRALALMAQMQLGTAQFFNASIDEACKTNKMAVEKFENFKTENVLAPQWGKNMTSDLTEKCK